MTHATWNAGRRTNCVTLFEAPLVVAGDFGDRAISTLFLPRWDEVVTQLVRRPAFHV
eukprot:CAMPEP_0185830512 /NCGR_PEP_ID=MMETSP1353-20130828/895_1 /TAXON_ID=1077150 /ORGANISM="Erythrolobus australicus, Strain CCMP3124" /LENGTH=56 /DNA_ID=CAMNT_0028528431 /DNA_START=378 /DNA_END=545 /DNA_ORIENTATION=-